MTATLHTEAQSPNDAPDTLGGLLYADAGRPRVPESEWAELVEAIARGDQASLLALYQRAHRLVYTLAVRICGSRETADEVTVDVFHEVWRRASTYDAAAGTVIAWIMNQARSRSIDRVRHEQRRKRQAPELHEVADAPDATDCIVLAERARTLRQALVVLSGDERTAIETAYFSELSYAQAAARLKLPLGTIKTRIRSGLHKLRRALDEPADPP